MALLDNVPRFIEKKLKQHGRMFEVHRPVYSTAPLASPLRTTLAYLYRDPRGHGNADWLLMIDDAAAQPGDYLVRGDEIYIYGRRSFMLPAQAMRCNHQVALLRRPAAITPTGEQPYGGICVAESQVVLGDIDENNRMVTGWPASILIGGRQGAGAHLPLSVANGGFEIMLPATVPEPLHASDLLLDNLGRQFITDTCELTDLGWRLAVKEVHP